MPSSSRAWIVAWAMAAGAGPIRADSTPPDERPVTIAVGIKAGFIPPIFVTPELVVHAPHLMAGAFGVSSGGGVGGGGSRRTLGAELSGELNGPGQNTPYLLGSWFHYEAAPDASGFFERMEVATVTAGYELKGRYLELQLGAGAMFLLRDDLPPCTGFGCVRINFGMLPALDLAARYRF